MFCNEVFTTSTTFSDIYAFDVFLFSLNLFIFSTISSEISNVFDNLFLKSVISLFVIENTSFDTLFNAVFKDKSNCCIDEFISVVLFTHSYFNLSSFCIHSYL